jgi:hypothetical protein
MYVYFIVFAVSIFLKLALTLADSAASTDAPSFDFLRVYRIAKLFRW